MLKKIDYLIQQNIGLIRSVLKQYRLSTDQEATSIAYEAAWKACSDYNESLGYARTTLVTVYIKNALGTYIRHIKRQRQLEIISYNNTAYSEGGIQHEFLELLATDESIEEQFMKDITCKQAMEVYYALLRTLDGKKKSIIEEWRRSDFEATNKSIASTIGVSQPYVNQVMATFKNSLRKRLKEINS